MSVRIRLRRVGKRNAPAHRIVVVDQRAPRDGKFIENVGSYNPRAKAESVDIERVDHWVSHGAQMSETVAAIVKRAKAGMSWSGTQTAHHRKPAEIKAEAAAGEEAPEAESADAAETEAEEVAETSGEESAESDPSSPEASAAEGADADGETEKSE